jgi:hypothetical protein
MGRQWLIMSILTENSAAPCRFCRTATEKCEGCFEGWIVPINSYEMYKSVLSYCTLKTWTSP